MAVDPNAYRYTDQHIRRQRELYEELALQYLRNYVGDFDLLLSYKRRVEVGAPLTVPMIRATLNCMRFDATVEGLPDPATLPDNVIDFSQRRRELPLPAEVAHRAVRRRPLFIKLRTTVRMPFGISSWPTACRIHRVAPDSHIEYRTDTGEYECKLHWNCKTYWNMGRVDLELLTLDDAYDIVARWQGSAFCKTCDRIQEMRNEE